MGGSMAISDSEISVKDGAPTSLDTSRYHKVHAGPNVPVVVIQVMNLHLKMRPCHLVQPQKQPRATQL